MSKHSSKGTSPMTSQAAARIQSASAKGSGGQVARGSHAARAQSAAAHNIGKGSSGSKK